MKKIPILLLLLTSIVSADLPKIFEGLLQEDIPVKAEIGIMVPPPEIEKYIAKVESAAQKNKEWFEEYSEESKPGVPLPFHQNLGLTREEYDDYLALWAKREFKSRENVILVLRKTFGDKWTITASGEAGAISTLRYDPEKDTLRSPSGTLKRIEDINADKDSILGAWTGKEWKFEENTGLGLIKENFALGKFSDKPFGLIIYRAPETPTDGRPLLDKSLVLRFALGEAGLLKAKNPPLAR